MCPQRSSGLNFIKWLAAQYSGKHAYAVLSYAQKYHEAIWQPAKAASLLALKADTRRYVMESLAALSKFTGTYEQWQAIKKQTGLKWQSSNKSVNLVKALLNDEIADIIAWLKDVTTKVSRKFSAVLIFAALTGLRPSEACNAVNLITELHQKGQLSDYDES
jgi:integrase